MAMKRNRGAREFWLKRSKHKTKQLAALTSHKKTKKNVSSKRIKSLIKADGLAIALLVDRRAFILNDLGSNPTWFFSSFWSLKTFLKFLTLLRSKGSFTRTVTSENAMLGGANSTKYPGLIPLSLAILLGLKIFYLGDITLRRDFKNLAWFQRRSFQ